jgi:ABC-type sugar transport system substrate-binding protein
MQFPYDMGWKSVDIAIELAKGNAITFDNPAAREVYVDVKLIRPADIEGKELGDVPISISGKTRGDINMG